MPVNSHLVYLEAFVLDLYCIEEIQGGRSLVGWYNATIYSYVQK